MNKHFISSTLLAIMATAVMIMTGSNTTWGRTSVRLNDTVRVGMNALDHVLQRPLGAREFPGDSTASRLDFSGAGGISTAGRGSKIGERLEISGSYWFTPVHGLRLTVSGGQHSVNSGRPRTLFGSLAADYVMNFSSLVRDYSSDRRFEVIGSLGAEYQRVRFDGIQGNVFGARASLQGRLNVGKSLFVYLEPRLTLLSGKRYGAGDNFRRFHPEASVMLGVGYRLQSLKMRRLMSDPFYNVDDDNLFFGLGGGVTSFLRDADRNTTGPVGTIFAGKWLSSTSGLRVKADFSRHDNAFQGERRYVATYGLDYVWNITNSFSGYSMSDVFGLNFNLGFALAYAHHSRARLYPGVETGLTASFRLSPNWSIFIEPQVQLFTRKFAGDVTGRSRLQPIGSVTAGIGYTIGNYSHRFGAEDFKKYLNDKRYFLTFGAAPAHRYRGNLGEGFGAMAAFGKRFTPVSSWRVSAEGEIYSRSPQYIQLVVAADYLCNISTSMAGYNANRLFELSGVVGAFAGAYNYRRSISSVFGAKVGLNGAFRLNSSLSLFVEPQLLAVRPSGFASGGWTPELRVMMGLVYRLGQPAGYKSGDSDGSRANFVGVAVGPTLCTGTGVGRHGTRLQAATDIHVGRWFNRVNGARVGLNYDYLTRKNNSTIYLGQVHADYMLNVTSLMDPDPERRFHIIGIVGGGIAFSNGTATKPGFVGNTAIQLRYNLPGDIDIHLEPTAGFYMNRALPGSLRNGTRIVMDGRLMLGASYRF